MDTPNYTGIAPQQYTGSEIIAQASTEFPDEQKAIGFYEQASKRLVNVNEWHSLAGVISASFQASDSNGNPLNRSVAQGDYMRVDVPGPGSKEGDGYDWVEVEALAETSDEGVQSTAFRVRPAPNPKGDQQHIAHFYDAGSTSTFEVTREGTKVYATIYDRNIKPNTDTNSTIDKIRHTPVALGAIAMFSKAQWQSLANGLMNREEE